jgi:hypothetical protein
VTYFTLWNSAVALAFRRAGQRKVSKIYDSRGHFSGSTIKNSDGTTSLYDAGSASPDRRPTRLRAGDSMKSLLLTAVLATALTNHGACAHDEQHASDWIGERQLTDPDTKEPCCGIRDCHPIKFGGVRETASGYMWLSSSAPCRVRA